MDSDIVTSETPYQKFIDLLYKSHSASKAVDHFDLDSESKTSRRIFATLLLEQSLAFEELIIFVSNNSGVLLETNKF